ncbi:TetR/AcrR family transcriptional regulator [Desulfosporosinus hippei]|uniref:DNA-binding transcriptional regulator, AcrR family n=1 Tax=Desulfosporosinus hippei DSM 8344 TaxID=1121419 RepID=A0A1G7SW17_9FIRM|nr:TetR/AcrR family transcriptional regulator [Desulfosporosinus hippei]SDG27171.1 DNA-binding transcriptional regulator, AcrR family [Desulfosporosinus hippei DSM 8344]
MDKKELSRKRILECAKIIIATEGIDKLTVLNLAKKCNISKRTFYEIFSSKSILIDELKQEGCRVPIIDEREVIIEKARERFAKKGYTRIDMDEIAKAAGLQRTTLYKYFKSKEELLEYCIEHETEMIKREAGRILLNVENPVETLKVYITGFCNYISNPYPNSLFSEAYNQLQYNKKIDQCSKDIHHFFVERFIIVLKAGIKSGIFRSDLDVKGVAIVVLATLNGLDFFSKIDPSLDIKVQIKNSVLDLLFNTILIEKT